jgi:putative redox protein
MAGEMTIQLLQVSGSTTEATIRTHRVLIDRPTEKGGADAGPMGGEFFLASIGGCFMSNLLAAIRARDLEITGVRTEVIATLADSPTRFESVELRISADTPDRELLQKLVEIADRGCIMMNTLRGKLDVRVKVGAFV